MTFPYPAALALLSLLPSFGCMRHLHQDPPGPMPIPVPWQAESTFRTKLQRGEQGEVVINDKDGLSPDEAAILAIDHNPSLLAFRAKRGIAKAELISAGILPNPQLDANGSAPIGGRDAHMLGYGIGLSWNIAALISHSSRIEAAQEHEISVDLEIAWQEWKVAQSAKLHTVRLIYLARQIAIIQQAVSYWEKIVANYKTARASQASTELELARAERSLAEWGLKKQDLELKSVVENTALAHDLGVKPGKVLKVQTSWHPRMDKPKVTELLAGLTKRRLDLIALQHAQQSSDEAMHSAALASFPAIDIGLHMGQEVDGVKSVGLSLSIDLPIFDHKQGELAINHARRISIEDEYAARLSLARTQTTRYEQEISILLKQLATAEKAASTATKLAALARSSADSGAMDKILAADSQDHAFESRLRKLCTEESLTEAQIALSISAGVAIP